MKSWQDVSKDLAKEHWEYLSKVLRLHGITEEDIHKIGFHYKTAFVHGFKHGLEYIQYGKGVSYDKN